MSCKDLRSRRSLDARSTRLRVYQRSNSSSLDMDVDFGSSKLSTNRKPVWSQGVCEIEEQASPRRDQLVNNRREWDPDGEIHRSTSPLNGQHLLSPKKNAREYNLPSGVTGKNEDNSGNGGSAGLLRLSGKQGWTASTWKKGNAKPQTAASDGKGPANFTPHSVNPQGMQHGQDVYGAPSTPRGSGDRLDRSQSATQANIISEDHGFTGSADRRATSNDTRPKTSPGGNAKHSKEWINMELERLRSEYQFKSQIATMLRSTLAGMKTQQLDSQSQQVPDWHVPASQLHKLPHQESPRAMIDQGPIREWSAPLTEASSGELEAMKSEAKERKKDISHLESHIMTLETHVKLLSDALDDERQENQDLSEENEILKAQVEKLTVAGEKLLKGMAAMRGIQE